MRLKNLNAIRIFNKNKNRNDDRENRDDRKNNNKNNKSNFDDYNNILKIIPIFFLFTCVEFKKVFCYKASNKELDRVKYLIEEEIKNLEFRYKGTIKREPLK